MHQNLIKERAGERKQTKSIIKLPKLCFELRVSLGLISFFQRARESSHGVRLHELQNVSSDFQSLHTPFSCLTGEVKMATFLSVIDEQGARKKCMPKKSKTEITESGT